MGIGAADTWTRRTATVVALAFPVVAAGVALAASATYDAAEVVDRPSPRWQTIEYEGVRVDIPASWHRADLGDCEFGFEHWTASADDACGDGPGVSFYSSATFDPVHGPRVGRHGMGPGPSRWSGWAPGGEYDVSVSAVHRSVAQRVLASVEPDQSVR